MQKTVDSFGVAAFTEGIGFAYVRIILFRIFDLLHSSFCLCLLRCMPICHTFSETRKDRFNAANPLHSLERVRF